jgi:hypothetical protein
MKVIYGMEKNHTMAFAAALAYYFVLALFPFLIFLSVVVARLPLPDFFSQVMGLIARVVPPSSMGPLKNLIRDTILSTHSRVLTFGILLTLWSASSGFTALIDALNAGYSRVGDQALLEDAESGYRPDVFGWMSPRRRPGSTACGTYPHRKSDRSIRNESFLAGASMGGSHCVHGCRC